MHGEEERPYRLQRAVGTLCSIARKRATTVVGVPGGQAVLHRGYPAAYDHNRLLVTGPCEPTALADAADTVLGGAGLGHRLVDVYDAALAARLADGFAARGYAQSGELILAATDPPLRHPPVVDIVELGVSERATVASAGWRLEQPDWDKAVVDQLGQRIATVLGAARAAFLAVRGADGAVAARADLYLRGGVAQVEEVMTDPAHQGQGLATALVLDAVARARVAEASLVFLVAAADDWPQHLYRRLGFTDLGGTVSFRR